MQSVENKIGVIGYGFVGRATSQLNSIFDVEIYDPHVETYKDNMKAFSQDVVFVCVPTPSSPDGSLDISIVKSSARKWRELKTEKSVLVIKSTIPIGTTERLKKELSTENIVHNPEFLTERTAMEDFLNPVEVIVGGAPSASHVVLDIYKKFYGKKAIHYFDTPSQDAEMIKMARNSFYALKVSFFNEVYELCNAIGTDYDEFKNLFTLCGSHPWIGNQHVSVPGPDGKLGFGGKCLPKDAEGLLKIAEEHGIIMKTLKAAVSANKDRR
tara:strand:- start:1290 stop:2096 length:807 start_codon:yes stop_codon:yes gene_type:complete